MSNENLLLAMMLLEEAQSEVVANAESSARNHLINSAHSFIHLEVNGKHSYSKAEEVVAGIHAMAAIDAARSI